jgi:hypothetical protein
VVNSASENAQGFWGRVLDISFVYFAVFLVFGLAGITEVLDEIIADPWTVEHLWRVLNFGYLVFWVYAGLLILHFVGFIVLSKARLAVLMILLATALALYGITYLSQFP